MIYTRNFIKYNEIRWKRRFALFPTEISRSDKKGIKTVVWLEFYESRYLYIDPVWIFDYERRLPVAKEKEVKKRYK